jgi:hypothetical protein
MNKQLISLYALRPKSRQVFSKALKMLLRSLRQGQCEEVYNMDNLFEGVDVGTLYEELILRKVTVNFFKINFLEPKEASK